MIIDSRLHLKLVTAVILVALVSCIFADNDSITLILKNAEKQCELTKVYDPAYYTLKYPNGDLPIHKGVCTDVIVRAFRAVGIDLQKGIHEDMKKNFKKYPQKWGLKAPDKNIDHRRVPNIQTYLERKGKKLPVSKNETDYIPGDLITWKLPGNLDHIGIVSARKVDGTEHYMIIHNIGNGTEMEDMLFEYEITGHYRYFQ
jgi:uncharacterized protein YijF (DUF1287 family)